MPSVLITGAARGIGRSTTLHLASKGWDVLAGVRNEADGEALAAEKRAAGRVTPVLLDVTNAEHVAALRAALPDRLDAVVNNAGIVVSGPIEGLALDDLRHQLEVNVTGQVAVTQVVLPRLRESRGRLVFISSVSGLVVTPMMGAYSASKFALEAVADALRNELAPWGVKVSLIEPAQIDTDLWQHADTALEESVAALTPAHRELYAKHIAGARKMVPRAAKMAAPVQNVSDAIEDALTAKRPKARYVPGNGPRAQARVINTLPTPVRDRLLRAAIGVPRKA